MRYLVAVLAVASLIAAEDRPARPTVPPALEEAIAAANAARTAKDFDAAEQSLRRAVHMARDLGLETPVRYQMLSRISNEYNSLGLTRESELLWQQEVTDTAAFPDAHLRTLMALATHYGIQQQFTKAVAVFQQAVAVAGKSYGNDDPRVRAPLMELARLSEQMGELPAAESALQRLESLSQVPGDSATRAAQRMTIQFGINSVSGGGGLADFYARHGRPVDAERIYRAVIDQTNQPVSVRQSAMSALVRLLEQQKRFEDALAMQQQVIREVESIDSGPMAPIAASSARLSLARIALNAGDTETADRVYQQELQRSSTLSGKDRQQYAMVMTNYAMTLNSQKRHGEAESLLKQYLDEAKSDNGTGAFSLSTAYSLLANTEYQQGHQEAGEAWRSQIPNVRPRAAIPSPEVQTISQANMALYNGKTGEALEQIQNIISSVAAQGPASAHLLSGLAFPASTLALRGDAANGEKLIDQAASLLEQWEGANSLMALNLRLEYCQRACPERGLTLLATGRQREVAKHGTGHPSEIPWVQRKITVYRQLERENEVEDAYQETIHLSESVFGPRSTLTTASRRAWASDLGHRKGVSPGQVESAWGQILQLIDEGQGPHSLERATAVTSYAQALSFLRLPDRAKDLLERELASLRDVPGSDAQRRNLEEGLKRLPKPKLQ